MSSVQFVRYHGMYEHLLLCVTYNICTPSLNVRTFMSRVHVDFMRDVQFKLHAQFAYAITNAAENF